MGRWVLPARPKRRIFPSPQGGPHETLGRVMSSETGMEGACAAPGALCQVTEGLGQSRLGSAALSGRGNEKVLTLGLDRFTIGARFEERGRRNRSQVEG